MSLKLCQAKLSCGNYTAIEMGAELLCAPHAAAQDLKKLLYEKTFDQLNYLASSGCGKSPLWAKFGDKRTLQPHRAFVTRVLWDQKGCLLCFTLQNRPAALCQTENSDVQRLVMFTGRPLASSVVDGGCQ